VKKERGRHVEKNGPIERSIVKMKSTLGHEGNQESPKEIQERKKTKREYVQEKTAGKLRTSRPYLKKAISTRRGKSEKEDVEAIRLDH